MRRWPRRSPTNNEVWFVPTTVVVDGSSIGSRLGPAAEAAWLRGLASGPWAIEPSGASDLVRAAELIDQYRDADIGLVDATIVALAERLGSSRI